jgi:hypothetical protein
LLAPCSRCVCMRVRVRVCECVLLSVRFTCSRAGATASTWTLDADPGITCWDGVGVQSRLVPFAAVTLVLYGFGIPFLFSYVFKKHGAAIMRDQGMWIVGLGDTPETNKDFAIRRRYSRSPKCAGLYSYIGLRHARLRSSDNLLGLTRELLRLI